MVYEPSPVPYGFDCFTFEPNEIRYFNQHHQKEDIYDYYLRFTRKHEAYTDEQKQLLLSAGRINHHDMDSRKQLFCGIKVQLGVTVVTNFLNLGLQYKRPNPGKSDYINHTWNGIVSGLTNPILQDNSYDIAFGNFLAYDEEMPFLKFGPFFTVESKLVLLTGNARNVLESSFATNVDRNVWFCIVTFIILMSLLASHYWHIPMEHIKIKSMYQQFQDYVFIYATMMLNKSSEEYESLVFGETRMLRTPIKILSYLWSAACLIMATFYSGELLAVILLSTEKSIDSISQLLETNPMIQPVIRQDDFTYKLMLKSQDRNMIELYNRTKIIPRPQVYTRKFIESIANRQYALLGDDELIGTIYDTYSKYFDLHIAKTTYLQFPISIMYRKEIVGNLEYKLRRGITQLFETGIVQKWYESQKEAYMNFYGNQTRSIVSDGADQIAKIQTKFEYTPMSMNHFRSFFELMIYGVLLSIVVFLMELIHARLSLNRNF